MEKERLLLTEKLENGSQINNPQAEIIELSMKFLSNPCKLWESGNIILQKLVLRLAFAEHLSYCRNEGYRTPKTTIPFKVLGGLKSPKREMVPLDGETSNELLEVFNDWGEHLNTTEITELLNDEPEIGGPQP